MDQELNLEIAGFFLTDSNDFLKRYKVLSESATHIGSRSKLLVDLLFSIECSLKGLIFIQSNVNEKLTYKKIRKHGHDLNYLLTIADTNSIGSITNFINNDLLVYKIDARYTLEAQIEFRSNGILGDKYYQTIANPIWLNTVYENAKLLYNNVNSMIPHIREVNFNDIDVEKIVEQTKKINNINR